MRAVTHVQSTRTPHFFTQPCLRRKYLHGSINLLAFTDLVIEKKIRRTSMALCALVCERLRCERPGGPGDMGGDYPFTPGSVRKKARAPRVWAAEKDKKEKEGTCGLRLARASTTLYRTATGKEKKGNRHFASL